MKTKFEIETVWIKRGNTPIECIVIGESSSIATFDGVKAMIKVRKIAGCPKCTFDIRKDEIIK